MAFINFYLTKNSWPWQFADLLQNEQNFCELRPVLNIFRNFSPYSVIILFLFAIGFKLQALLHPALPHIDPDQVVWKGIMQLFRLVLGNSAFACTFFALINSFGQALYLNKIAASQHLFHKATYLPAVTFLLVSSLYPSWNYLSAPLLCNWLSLLIISNTLQLYATAEPRKKLFNIGCFISLAIFLHFPYIFAVPMLLLSLTVLRPFKVAEWIIALLGIITPVYFLAGILFLTDNFPVIEKIPSLSIALPRQLDHPAIFLSIVSVFVISGVMGVYYLQTFMSRMLIQPKKLWWVIIIFAVLSIFASVTTVGKEYNQWLITLPAIALVITNSWLKEQFRWISNGVFYLMIATLIYVQWFS